jgi:hypothetical protein
LKLLFLWGKVIKNSLRLQLALSIVEDVFCKGHFVVCAFGCFYGALGVFSGFFVVLGLESILWKRQNCLLFVWE